MENREKLFKQYKSDCPQTIGETDTAFDNDNFIDWLCQQNKQLLDEIDMLKFQLKAADSVNENLSKQVEWISVEDRLPLANESGSWDGKRSDVYLGKYKDDTYCLFRIYEGFLDGSDFIEYYDENDNSINAPVYYKSIT